MSSAAGNKKKEHRRSRDNSDESLQKYIDRFVDQSALVVNSREQQIRDDKERLQHAIKELKQVQNVQGKALRNQVQNLNEHFRQQLHQLQEKFVREASELSDEFKRRVQECKKQFDTNLSCRVEDLSLGLSGSSVSASSASLPSSIGVWSSSKTRMMSQSQSHVLAQQAQHYVSSQKRSHPSPSPAPATASTTSLGHRFDSTLRLDHLEELKQAPAAAPPPPQVSPETDRGEALRTEYDRLAGTYGAILDWFDTGSPPPRPKPQTSTQRIEDVSQSIQDLGPASFRRFASQMTMQLAASCDEDDDNDRVQRSGRRLRERARRSRRTREIFISDDDQAEEGEGEDSMRERTRESAKRSFLRSRRKEASSSLSPVRTSPDAALLGTAGAGIQDRLRSITSQLFSSSDDDDDSENENKPSAATKLQTYNGINGSSNKLVNHPRKGIIADSFRQRVLALQNNKS